jgi:hypothetical protein
LRLHKTADNKQDIPVVLLAVLHFLMNLLVVLVVELIITVLDSFQMHVVGMPMIMKVIRLL